MLRQCYLRWHRVPPLQQSRRRFSSSFHNSKGNTSSDQLIQKHLYRLGYSDEFISQQMIHVLKSVFGNALTIAQVDSLGLEGLKALSKSIVDSSSRSNDSSRTNREGTLHVHIPHHNSSFDVKMRYGETIFECVKFGHGKEVLGEYLEFACGGNMSCTTCHVYVDYESFQKMDPPCEAEIDILDLAYKPRQTSRLSCQITMEEKIDGMTITIPSGVHNLWN